MFGIFNHENAAEITYYALHALQHRGQESAGIITSDGTQMKQIRDVGLVRNIFSQQNIDALQGQHAIGHIHYGGSLGDDGILNVQPFLFRSQTSTFGLCHNGSVVNANILQAELEATGSIFQTTSNAEILAHLIKRTSEDATMMEKLHSSLGRLEGGFTFIVLTPNEMFVALDSKAMKPLALGRIGEKGYTVASETCAFDAIGASFVRDVKPGELIRITNDGLESVQFVSREEQKMCSMEYIYFARPDSDIDGVNVHEARRNCGIRLAEEAPAPTADIVIGVPDSGLSAAIGFAEGAGLPFETGMVKNRYIGRTFIEPTQELREQGVKMKLSVIAKVVAGKSVVLVDDSIVRGTTSRNLVAMLKKAGAKEVHMRIAAPEIKHPCFYGVDYSSYDELISASHTIDEICAKIGADSLGFMSVEGLTQAVGRPANFGRDCGQCTACFNGNYPTKLYK